ncbi:MAG: DUF445 family protein [Marinobacter sp.]|nr:DUF445 family protein [Marinobacter sp.]
MDALIQEFLAHWWLYLSMPVISALVGFGTNVVAIKMMFLPVEFIGKPPLLGWQGIIPRRAAKMASISVDTITEHLITPEEIFSRLDPDRIAAELEPRMNDIIEDMVDEIMLQYEPRLWEALPQMIKRQIYRRVKREAPALVAEIMDRMRDNLSELFDLKEMVVEKLTQDRRLLNKIFYEVGEAEFKFIGRSGLYFGGLFGLVQMLVWLVMPFSWILPAFGLLVGYATNWIALKLIFDPKEPMKVGPVTFQGLFMKRQEQVAADYGKLVASTILTPANIIEGILKGSHSDKLFAMIGRHVQKAVDGQTSYAKPFVTFMVGTRTYREMKQAAVDQVVKQLPDTLKHIERYANDALDLERTLSTRLQGLGPTEFEGMLRPAFEQDEWMLICVGAVLGMMVGFFQLLVMFS